MHVYWCVVCTGAHTGLKCVRVCAGMHTHADDLVHVEETQKGTWFPRRKEWKPWLDRSVGRILEGGEQWVRAGSLSLFFTTFPRSSLFRTFLFLIILPYGIRILQVYYVPVYILCVCIWTCIRMYMCGYTHTQLKVLFSPLGARSPPVRMSESGEERSRAL